MPDLRRGAGPQGLLGALDPLQGLRLGEKGPFVVAFVGHEGGRVGRRVDEGVVGLDDGLVRLDGRLEQGRFEGVVGLWVELGLIARWLERVDFERVDFERLVDFGRLLVGRLVLVGRRLTCRRRQPTGSA